MKYCSYCNQENEDRKKFCTNCGMRFDVSKKADSKPKNKEIHNTKDEKIQKDDTMSENDKEKLKTKYEKLESETQNTSSETTNKNSKEIMSEKNNHNKKSKEEKPEKDPFAYDFKKGDKKKANDNFWLFVIGAAVVIFIIVIGTSRNKNNDENAESDNNSAEQTEQLAEKNSVTYEYSATSTLEDTSGVGFDYAPSQVGDKDFSTAWIEGKLGTGIDEEIVVAMSEEKEISHFGIVPGFARDEQIFKENNRPKKIEVMFSDESTIEADLEDAYGMQFVEFEPRKTNSITIRIKEVYRGTKYNDTAIAEIDIDSDYVKNKDSQAALTFYEENKKESALRPN